MNQESEHEDLHALFGAQVAHLPIGPSPTGAVMRGGTALRTRRRVAVTSGVAALAVLPVAAVALFPAAGTGGRSMTPGAVPTGGHVLTGSPTRPDPSSTSSPDPSSASSPDLSKTIPPFDQPLPAVMPTPGSVFGEDAPPNAVGVYQVLASGTLGGQHWRLVRDRFVTDGQSPITHGLNRLPVSQQGRPGTKSCEGLGVQWGDRALGTHPDFNEGTVCSPLGHRFDDPADVDFHSHGGVSGYGPLAIDLGRVDATKVATVTVNVDGRSTAPLPVVALPGERVGYYLAFLDSSVVKNPHTYNYTYRDAAGKEISTTQSVVLTPPPN